MGGLRVLIGAYREWAFKVLPGLTSIISLAQDEEALIYQYKTFEPDVIVLLGWSWMVPKEIWSNTTTICLHPSKLPLFRGGSPIQHQILNGVTDSAITFFIIDDRVDGGNVISQLPLSLEGSIKEIFERVTIATRSELPKILAQHPNYKVRKQTEEGTLYRRRQASQSKLHYSDFKERSAKQLYDFIRALGDPYPNAYVVCADGKKLYFKEVTLDGA